MHLLWLLQNDLLCHWALIDGHDFFEGFFRDHLPNNIFGFVLKEIVIPSPSCAHTGQCRLVDCYLELILDGTCAFRAIDTLLIIELFLNLLNGLLVAGGTSSWTVLRGQFDRATEFALDGLLLGCGVVFGALHVIIFNFYHGL